MTDTVAAQKCPYQAELEKGRTYQYCRCGRSKLQPFCDDAHVGTDIEPFEFVAERTEIVNLCGCKETGDPPFCDGSHNVL